jgi:ribosomal protein L11 methyltransferase
MVELCLQVAQDAVDDLSDALMELGALSVSVEDADALTDQEKALYGEPGMPAPLMGWTRSVVIALFEHSQAAGEVGEWLKDQSEWSEHLSVVQIREVIEQDWVRLTQSQFDPVQITSDFWIVPSWHELPNGATRVLRLDPGLAFGTGTHPTTKMCLKWIATHPPTDQHVLDYGCGSGILAMGAALYGATRVDAVDIDSAAVSATIDNARANHLEEKINASLPERANHDEGADDAGKAGIAGKAGKTNGQYDTVLANILASPLKVLAPLLISAVKPGGSLILAGILERQAQELITAYEPYCTLRVLDQMDGWILMGAVGVH